MCFFWYFLVSKLGDLECFGFEFFWECHLVTWITLVLVQRATENEKKT